ncbi:hypothetical protein, partial [Sulfitobacter pontiacus]|uniref:hypothetical protein n=1 Tax=Sulfitobacter pontiacus TaxID=60137 RepID=UPI0030ECA6C1
HAKSFLPRQVRQAHRPIGQIDIFFDAPCCTANFRLHVLNVHIETALLELVHNRLTFSVFTACTRFLDKAVVYMTAPNGSFVRTPDIYKCCSEGPLTAQLLLTT